MSARKAWAYITRRSELLVFTHPDHPEAGIQVPGGTLMEGEDPRTAVLREAREESGFTGLSIVRELGVRTLRWADTDCEVHAYHLVFTEPVPERWEHGEFSYDEPIRFAFSWVSLRSDVALWPEQAAFLPELKRALGIELDGADPT